MTSTTTTLRCWAVIVAAGHGTRFGSPKQFALLAGRPVVAWSIDTARSMCAGVVVVMPGGAFPVDRDELAAVSDTIKRLEAGGALRTVDRAALRAVQTPQAFRADVLRRAHASGDHATDDATLVEAMGGRVVLVDGHPANAKITVPSDLVVAAALLAEVHRC
jgi:2-C-methyl-D-erythritol 4-phosphate cytidylyltransferase